MGWQRILRSILNQCQLVVGGEVDYQAPHPLPAHPAHRDGQQPRIVRVDPGRRCLLRRRRLSGRPAVAAPVFGPILDERALVTQAQVRVQTVALEENSLGALLTPAKITK